MTDVSGMTLSEIRTRIPVWYNSSAQKDGPSYHLESDAGRGKSTIMSDFPNIMKEVDSGGNYGYSYINGLTITLPFLNGFMEMHPDARSTIKRRVTDFTLPAYWYTDEGKSLEEYDGGLIFVDEEDKMEQEERKLTRDMKLLKRVGVHQLPPGWVVWSAGNPIGSRNGGTKTFDFILNSQMLIKVRDSTEEWVAWAKRNGVLPEMIDFCESNPQILFQPAPKVQQPFGTPRSLTQADMHLRSVMKVYSKSKVPTDLITQTEIAGGIGKENAEQLFQHLRLSIELPPYVDCVANPTTIPIPAEPDRLRLFAYKLGDWAKPQDADALGVIMGRMPSEFQYMMVRMIRDRNATVLVQPAFRAWCKANAQLTAIIEVYERDHSRRAA